MDRGYRVARSTLELCKDLHTIFLLTMWELWKHRNAVVFDGVSPAIDYVLRRVTAEGKVWATAGLIKGCIDLFFGTVGRWVSSDEYCAPRRSVGIVDCL